jgi:hypothetical protein
MASPTTPRRRDTYVRSVCAAVRGGPSSHRASTSTSEATVSPNRAASTASTIRWLRLPSGAAAVSPSRSTATGPSTRTRTVR